MTHSSRLVFLIVSTLVLCLSVPALAEIGGPLGEVEWGDKKSDVVSKVKDQLLQDLRERDDLRRDRVKMQREHKKVLEKVEKFEKSYEKLDKGSDYRVSVISNEFTKDNGEALMRLKDKVAQRYYFFVDRRFYKLVVAYNQTYLDGVDFETFVVQAAKKYGKPADTIYGTINGEEELVRAVWKDGQTELRIDNRKEFFDTFTMTFTDRKKQKALEKSGRVAGGDDEREEQLSKRVQELTSLDRSDDNEDVVDSLVGDSDVDLNEGRPVDEQVRHGEESSEVAAKSESSESKSKSKKKKKRKKKKKKKKKRDFSDIDSQSGDDDLIIY